MLHLIGHYKIYSSNSQGVGLYNKVFSLTQKDGRHASFYENNYWKD